MWGWSFFSHLYFLFFEPSMSFVHFSIRLLGVFFLICGNLHVFEKFSPFDIGVANIFCSFLFAFDFLYVYFSHVKVFYVISLHFIMSGFYGILRPKHSFHECFLLALMFSCFCFYTYLWFIVESSMIYGSNFTFFWVAI